jgi:small subunit ribosomal protein S2
MALPVFTVSELLAAGVHFGHRDFRWNPKLKQYIYGTRNGIHIFDLTKTVPLMYTALAAIEATVARGGRVLFVGTKKQAQGIAKEAAERCGMYYVNYRWLGGILTNWKTVSQSIKRLKDIEEGFTAAAAAKAKLDELLAAAPDEAARQVAQASVKNPLAHLTKKERLMRTREQEKLRRVLGGIMNMAGLPDLVVVLSAHEDQIAIKECNVIGIPVIAVVDSNSTDAGVSYVIPGNDDSARALSLYAKLCADAVLSGIALQASGAPAAGAGADVRGPRAPRSGTAAAAAAGSITLSAKAKEAMAAADAAPAV